MTVYLVSTMHSLFYFKAVYLHIRKKCLFHGLQLINNVVPFFGMEFAKSLLCIYMYIKEFQESPVNAI